jgi:hypothetical protein
MSIQFTPWALRPLTAFRGRFAPWAALALLMAAAPLSAATPGQSDTFSDLTSDNWFQGPRADPADLTVITSGGPAGSGDAFLQMTATGSGANGKLTMFNDSQWTGSYAGITAISADLTSFDSPDQTLNIRFAIDSAPGDTSGYVTDPFSLTDDGLWHHVTFPLDLAHLTAVNSPDTLSTLLANVGELRLVNAASPSLTGDAVSFSIGIDNITAVPAPEPASLALFALGALALLPRRR